LWPNIGPDIFTAAGSVYVGIFWADVSTHFGTVVGTDDNDCLADVFESTVGGTHHSVLLREFGHVHLGVSCRLLFINKFFVELLGSL